MIELLGSKTYGGWYMDTEHLNKDSVVYSFGIGHDASWDIQMTERFECKVHAFDMTPDSIEWVSKQNFPSKFIFHPYGISHSDGNAPFNLRKKPQWPMHEASMYLYPEGEVKMLPVKTLKTIMKEMGHTHIDVLKLDIEGGEYNVLKDIKNIPIRQILVELHTPTKLKRMEKLAAQIRLWTRGYRLMERNVADYTFLNNDFIF